MSRGEALPRHAGWEALPPVPVQEAEPPTWHVQAEPEHEGFIQIYGLRE